MSADSEARLRREICEAGRLLHRQNLVAATDGNISARLGPNRFLCTPSGVSKGRMLPKDLIIADEQGRKVRGHGKVTSEFFTHLAAYEERPDIQAVVHAHPPAAVAFTLAGHSLEAYTLPEVVYTLGAIPTAAYATPGTPEGADSIREWIRRCDAVLMDRHGALTTGASVMDACLKMEKLEHACYTLLLAHGLGRPRELDATQIARLKRLRVDYGVSGKAWFPDEN